MIIIILLYYIMYVYVITFYCSIHVIYLLYKPQKYLPKQTTNSWLIVCG